MTRLAFFISMLVLNSLYGLSTQEKRTLRTLPNDGGDISCTGHLICEQSEILCIPNDIQTAVTPVLVPSDLKAETVKKCHNDSCSLCVQVTVEISAAFLTEHSEELEPGGCDIQDYYIDEYMESNEENETSETKAVNVYLQLNNSNSGSLLCAILMIVPPNFSCYTMKVTLPLSAVSLTHNSSSMVVGSLVYNCIRVQPGADMNIVSYSNPRYSKILSISHEVPNCTQLHRLDKISKCESPVLDLVNNSSETSVGIVNGTNNREIRVRVSYGKDNKATYSNSTLIGEQRHYIPQSDIVPCMCIHAWYQDLEDAVRTKLCPFRNYSEEGMLNKSKLEVKNDKIAVYSFNANCYVKAETSFCWKSGNPSQCRQIPNTRSDIVSQHKYRIEGLQMSHPSLCLQVSVKGRVLHTECLSGNVRFQFQNEALLVLENQNQSVSLCFMEDGGCKTLNNLTNQTRADANFLEQKLVGDMMTDQCVKILSGPKQEIYICSVDKYLRTRWTWSRVLCLLIVALVLLIILLKIDDLKKWLKSVTADKPEDEIFKNRRVLILYSPDNPAYEELVRVFAQSLEELNLNVVLDQWHRTEIAKVNPLPWYQKQKSEVFEKHGLIILLFSEGACERYMAWKEPKAEQIVDSDPYGSFGAVLNCVYADFQKEQAKGHYLVATFCSNSNVVPDMFSSLPVYMLPSNLLKLLQVLAGDDKKILRKRQAAHLSAKIRDHLQEPLKKCPPTMNIQTTISKHGNELSESSGGNSAVELQKLV